MNSKFRVSCTIFLPVFTLMVFIASVIHGVSGSLWCYECGTGVPEEPSCDYFRLSAVWTPYRRECGENKICVKTHNYAQEEFRGCTPKKSLFGYEHTDGCWTHEESGTLFCYCKTNLCNLAVSLCEFKLILILNVGLCILTWRLVR